MTLLTATAASSALWAAIALIAMILAELIWSWLLRITPVDEASEDEISEDEYDLGGEASVTVSDENIKPSVSGEVKMKTAIFLSL